MEPSPAASLASFHPQIAHWFGARLGMPTAFQCEAWDAIRRGEDALLAAPTGSGKTLAAFLVALDQLWRLVDQDALPAHPLVLYVSPLKALSNDVEKNLNRPLREIRERVFQEELRELEIRVGLRTGDTPQKDRAAMLKKPPHILVTTPESLYLLLTSKKARGLLRGIRTVILDEVHALLPDRRGAHLLLSLQRLEALCGHSPQRIGLSATQKPIGAVAQYLTGMNAEGKPRPCTVINAGLRRHMDLAVVLPGSPLQAVMPLEVWEEVYGLLEEHIRGHKTTLVFVNTRRLAERVSHHLGQTLGEEHVAAHHGSMSRERRLKAETALKEGRLKVMVATASLELGIDIGEVDLCVQLGGPKTISSFVQRMGRSGHFVGGVPKGRIFPLTRDELVEAAALMRCVKYGELDTLILPRRPLDILAQQIVAEVACGEWGEQELFALFKRAAVYSELPYSEFQDVVAMLSEGFTTRRGRRGAFLHRDQIHGRLRPRRGARLAAITCGGAIPDNFDVEVKLEPGDLLLGTVNEDFAIESLPGDVFQLGNRSWRILRVEASALRVADAGDEPPGIPFWFGEAPARSAEFSQSVSQLRMAMEKALGDAHALKQAIAEQGDAAAAAWRQDAQIWLSEECGLVGSGAEQIVDYLASGYLALGRLPTDRQLILERFFDEGGAMHLVLHAPFGSRLNRALGLSLRKRFCRKFNFELQAAATEDAVILSLGASHSFPLEEVWRYLHADHVRAILIQALLAAPMFEVRWRWNATRALAILRMRGGKRTPPAIQRLQAQDLAALVFPDSIACPENLGGDRDIPDHPLVRQTLSDCLHEAMDIEALENLLRQIAAGEISLFEADVREPSPLAEAILSARPYAFLDDAPLEDRRTRAVKVRSDWTPANTDALARLDPSAVAKVQGEAAPTWRDADELHDALCLAGFLCEAEITGPGSGHLLPAGGGLEPRTSRQLVADLQAAGRIQYLPRTDQQDGLWFATERQPEIEAAFASGEVENKDTASRELLRSRLEVSGPVTEAALLTLTQWPKTQVQVAMLGLEAEGFAFRGQFPLALRVKNEADHPETLLAAWCDRHLLSRIHRLARQTARKRFEPVSSANLQDFLFRWHRLYPQDRLEGPEGLAEALRKLEGCEASLAIWENEILPARVAGYRSDWLDGLLLSGRFLWRRLTSPAAADASGRPAFHKGLTIAFFSAGQEPLPTPPLEEVLGHPGIVIDHLRKKGPSFWREIAKGPAIPLENIREGLKEAVARGWVACDGLAGLKALLQNPPSSAKTHQPFLHSLDRAGRWYLTNPSDNTRFEVEKEEKAERMAQRLLCRFGMVFRKLAENESRGLPWRDLLRVFRLMEDRGEIHGGRFVVGYSGEQFALPDAAEILRRLPLKMDEKERLISLAAQDPLNLQGLLSPGPRLPAQGNNRIVYFAGEPIVGRENNQVRVFSPHSEQEIDIGTQMLFPGRAGLVKK